MTRRARRLPFLLALTILLVAAFAFWSWKQRQLPGLPDVGDPPGVQTLAALSVSDADNAYIEYRAAAKMLKSQSSRSPWDAWGGVNWDATWSQLDPEMRAWVTQSDEALAVCRRGTEKPDALYIQPNQMGIGTIILAHELLWLVLHSAWRGSECEEKGDMQAAWGWYRAILRCSRHSGRHGCLVDRDRGVLLYEIASKRLVRWAADPRTGAPLLRRALDETLAIDAMTEPASESLKVNYLSLLNAVNGADAKSLRKIMLDFGAEGPAPVGWIRRSTGVDLRASYAGVLESQSMTRNDYERSRRVIRLLFANWLAQCDRPSRLRPKPVSLGPKAPSVYPRDPATLATSQALSPQALADWYDSTTLAKFLWNPTSRDRDNWPFKDWPLSAFERISTESIKRADLIITLASQLYLRERGRLPQSPEELVGTYLKSLPEGDESATPIVLPLY